MGGMIGAWKSFGQDSSVTKQKVKTGTAKRTLQYATPYSGLLALFLLVVVVDAAIGVVNPLLYRQIINKGILQANSLLIVRLAIAHRPYLRATAEKTQYERSGVEVKPL